MFKFLVVALLAVGTGIITHKLNKKNLASSFIASLIVIGICLFMLSPAGNTSQAYDAYNLYNEEHTVVLPCKHCHSLQDLKTNTFMVTTTYQYYYQLVSYKDSEISAIYYCTKCYTELKARNYYNSNKKKVESFVTK